MTGPLARASSHLRTGQHMRANPGWSPRSAEEGGTGLMATGTDRPITGTWLLLNFWEGIEFWLAGAMQRLCASGAGGNSDAGLVHAGDHCRASNEDRVVLTVFLGCAGRSLRLGATAERCACSNRPGGAAHRQRELPG